ncbi:MAG: sucrase ferredoxin [Actinomycetota bacterium]
MEPASPKHKCSAITRELSEPLYGTAPTSQAWVLLEQPGAWGPDALSESSIDPGVGAELTRISKAENFRILLLRRSAGRNSNHSQSCFLARSAQGETWMERLELPGPVNLLDIDFEVLKSPAAPGLGEAAEALWAVCTHGRRDPCCAEYGRKVIRIAAETGDESFVHGLWESSHQGGHRFAANLALFPHGLFYGQVEPDGARAIIDSYRDGRLILDGYRGRSAFDEVTQVADYLVRRQNSLVGIDDLVPREVLDLGEGRFGVTFDSPTGLVNVQIQVSEGPMRPESCNKPKLTAVKLYRQVEIEPDIAPVGFPTV